MDNNELEIKSDVPAADKADEREIASDTDIAAEDENTAKDEGGDEDAQSASVKTEGAARRENMGAADYEELMRSDLRELKALFPHLRDKSSIRELEDPLRYAKLRDLGLSPKEAYLATGGMQHYYDNRSHMTPSVTHRAAASEGGISQGELEAARLIFSDLSDREIQKLYKKVTK